ncbi:MAG: SH3 domain-containing protein [Selenomonadaceae bacterium]|nr:SH3 domain-containing protein [Selenomonadaceae bacterium]
MMFIKLLTFVFTITLIWIANASVASASIEIADERATPEYWIERNPSGDNILLNSAQIEQLNAQMRDKDRYAADLANYPEVLSADRVKALIKIAEGKYLSNLYLVTGDVQVRYAVTVERGDIRLLPKGLSGDKYDSLQGTAIDPAEAVAVLIESADGRYVFVQSRNYVGWLDKSKIAFTDRETWLTYVNPEDFLVVINNKKTIDVNGKNILFQMGSVIPIVDASANDDVWIMRLPTSVNGQLEEVNVPIAMYDESINKGWLACTENTFIRQAFKFLGDVYGWGGIDDSVDCSAFVSDVYRSMGIEIPRDANRQEACAPIWAVFNNVSTAERFDIVGRAPSGSLLFKPGHVMMRLGNDDNGSPLVIHSASSYFSGGRKIYIRKVIVSDLHYKNGSGVETINGLTGIAFVGN